MKLEEAVRILESLLKRDADCRCGNHNITEEDTQAIEIVVQFLDTELG